MSTLHGRARIGPDGAIRIPLPSSFSADSEVEYVLELRTAFTEVNGRSHSGISKRLRTGAARRESLRRLAGSIDDPTFRRLPQGESEPLEPMG